MPPAVVDRPKPGQKAYRPYGAAEQIFYDFSTEIMLAGPADTGKSRAILERMFQLAETYPRARMLMTRKTRASLTESAMVTFEQKVVPDGHPVLLGPQREQRHSYRFPNGSEIITGGLGDQKEKTRVMSTEYDVIYVQEAREIAESEWEELSTRCSGRAGNMPFHQLIGDTNPDTSMHWIKRRAGQGKLKLLESRHEDNPSMTPERMAVLDALTGVRYKRLRLGLWVAAEGIIYEGWDAAVHVIDGRAVPSDWPRYLAIDFGFINPFVAQWWAVDPDGRLLRYREMYRTQTLVEDAAHEIRRHSVGESIRAIVCDHDAEDRATLARHLSCNCPDASGLARIPIGTTAARKDVSPGIQAVAQRLKVQGDGHPRLRLLRDGLVARDPLLDERKLPCSTEEEVEGYVWDTAVPKLNPDGTARKEEPLKLNDHGCLVAGTLITTDHGLVPIEQVAIGTRVLTRHGYRRVVDAMLTQRQAHVLTARFSNGAELTGTGNHPVWTRTHGWASIDALRYNDVVRSRSISTARSAAVPVRVLSVSDAGRADVYNLTVDDQHEYFANGVLVSNCDAMRYMVAYFDLGANLGAGFLKPVQHAYTPKQDKAPPVVGLDPNRFPSRDKLDIGKFVRGR